MFRRRNAYSHGRARLKPNYGHWTTKNGTSKAAGNVLHGSANGSDYGTVPFTVFTDPRLAGVGSPLRTFHGAVSPTKPHRQIHPWHPLFR